MDIELIDNGPGERISVSIAQGLIVVERHVQGVKVGEVAHPYPSAGLAGGTLSRSPSGKLILLAFHSGQGEEAYLVMSAVDGLRRVCGSPYVVGESGSYAFCPDERHLVMALPTTCSEWLYHWEEEVAEGGGDDFTYGLVRFHELEGEEISDHELRVHGPMGRWPNTAGYDPELRPRFEAADRLRLEMPWGALILDLPLPAVVDLFPPSGSR